MVFVSFFGGLIFRFSLSDVSIYSFLTNYAIPWAFGVGFFFTFIIISGSFVFNNCVNCQTFYHIFRFVQLSNQFHPFIFHVKYCQILWLLLILWFCSFTDNPKEAVISD